MWEEDVSEADAVVDLAMRLFPEAVPGPTLSDPEAIARLANVIRKNGVRHGQICFEVTESAVIASIARSSGPDE